MHVSRVEGIQCLLGETSVTKNSPATPVVHGTLHLGIGGRQPVRILCRRSVRCAPCVRLRFQTRLWSLAGGGAIGNLSGYSPARSEGITPGNRMARYTFAGVLVWTALLFSPRGLAAPRWLVAAGSASRLKDLPCKTRLSYGNRKHARIDPFSKCWDFGLSYL